jgi:hypothetical protein
LRHNFVGSRHCRNPAHRRNCQKDDIIHQRTNDWDNLTTVTIVQSIDRELGCTNYVVKLYVVAEDMQGYTLKQLQTMKPEQADACGVLTHACTATIQLDTKTNHGLRFHHEALL